MSKRVDPDIHDLVRGWRAWRGWTQVELADAVGVTAGAVGQWETTTTPTHENVVRMCVAFGISLPVFYTGAPKARRVLA